MQTELDRYNNLPNANTNPLPRPPEIIPLVTNLTRDHAAASTRSSHTGVVPLGLGVAPGAPAVAAPTSQSRSSSGSSRARAASVHFSDTSPPNPPKESKYAVDANGTELRQEKTRRPHFIIPGAPHSHRVLPPPPPRLTDGDSDSTPRPFGASSGQVSYPGRVGEWPAHLQQYGPKDGSPCVWTGAPDSPHEILPNEVPYEDLHKYYSSRDASSNAPQAGPSTEPPPVIPPPPPNMPPMARTARSAGETSSVRIRVSPAGAPVYERDPNGWRVGRAHEEGFVLVFNPGNGYTWIHEEDAAKLPIRARNTESRHPYVVAKDPSEVDEPWRLNHNGAPPGPNPLQLSGVPEAPVAGPSTSVVQRGQYDSRPSASSGASTLFRNAPGSSERTVAASATSSNVSVGAMNMVNAPARSNPTAGQGTVRGTNHLLGLNLASFPEAGRSASQPESEPSPASSWGASRNSSLASLHLHNLPPPHAFPRSTESMDELPIGELNGGPIVLTDALTPRQTSTSSLFGDDRSISSRSERSQDRRPEASGLLLNPSAGSSRQVVSSVRDLEDVNRSLMQLATSEDQDSQTRRSSRPSRHSRQPSATMSGDEREAMVGPRTGIALYSSRPMTNYSGSRGSSDPSTEDPSPPAQSRPRSGASTRSHAESTFSHQSSHSVHSSHSSHSATSHRSSDPNRRARRGSTASALDGFRDHDRERERGAAAWTTVPADMQPYGSSRDRHSADSRSQKSQESIPRAMEGLGSGPGSMSSLGLSFEAPSTSSAVTGNGEEAAGIHAPRPVNGRRSSLFGGTWAGRSGH